ncbi:agmatine deiminase family protein [Sphingobacteriaceae bacterium WQ 2009]|uniref:Agmatine deiminase family protein n=1 Tax=Rhinopithecimicrobium faecis TaxID=2820698 RepID=A0A8T4HBA0_9SPHI|nr:agmatine deiminase family protein [Sphingobacteriaceae bacterium WQ 2009]
MLYISDLLTKRYPTITQKLNQETQVIEIPNTNDIWIRDFMPIKNTANDWILFRYFSKYLRNSKHHSLITDNKQICNELGIAYTYCDMILDGGSVVYKDDLYFVSERIIDDNPSFSKIQILTLLEDIFKTERIIILPEAPNDFTGHLDGVLSILDNKTILLNEYNDEYANRVRNILKSHQFNIDIIPYNPYQNKTYQSAKGIYINFIKTDSTILLPIFNQKEDNLALAKIQELYPNHHIATILCNDLAKEGGLLHCVSWEV